MPRARRQYDESHEQIDEGENHGKQDDGEQIKHERRDEAAEGYRGPCILGRLGYVGLHQMVAGELRR